MDSNTTRYLPVALGLFLAGCACATQPSYDLAKLRMMVERSHTKCAYTRVVHYYLDADGREVRHGPWMEFQPRVTHRVPRREGYYHHGQLHGHVVRYDALAFFAEALVADTDGTRGVPLVLLPMADDVPLITFHARNVNAGEVFRIVTSVAGLRARLTENGVLIVSPGQSRPGDVTYKPPPR